MRGRQFDAALFVVVEKQPAGQITVVLALRPVNFIFKTAGKRAVWHGYGAPLVAVVDYKPHIAAKHTGKTGVEVEW